MAKYPALRIAILLGLGISIGARLEVSLWWLISGFLGALAFRFWLDKKNRKWLEVKITRLSTAVFFVAIILFGGALIHLKTIEKPSEIEDLFRVSAWEQVELRALIQKEWKNSIGKQRANVEVISSNLDKISIEQNLNARLLFDDDVAIDIQPGDTIHFSATIIPVQEKRNPFQFDYQKYLLDQGIRTQIRLDSLYSKSANSSKMNWAWWRARVLQLVENNFSNETAPIAKALLLGHKQDLEGATKRAFARAGLSHIMAVSGLHVGFIVAPFWMIIPFFWTRKYGKIIGLILLVTILFGYAGLTGFSTSVIRASIMAVLLSVGKLFNKAPNSINLTGVAAILVLIIDPSQLFEIGFQLSFGAVLVILLTLPVLQRRLPYWLRTSWYALPIMTIVVSFIVQLGLYPLQVYYFGEVSLIGPLANAFFVPLLGIIVPLSLVSLVISSVFPPVGYWLNIPSDLFLKGMHEFVILSSDQSWVWIEMELQTMLLFPLWLSVICFIACWRLPKLKWKWLITSLSIICLLQVEAIVKSIKPKELRVTVFDVGQGDASLIQTPNGKNVLIDTGVWSPGYNSGESIILPHLEAEGIKKLDAVILSHPHSDHIGGILSLLGEMEIGMIYNSGYKYDSRLYQNYNKKAMRMGVQVEPVESGDYLEIDPSVLMLILGPEPSRFGNDPNEHSVVINLVYGSSEFLFTGDAGVEQENRLIENYSGLLDTDFLKVGHHGSKTSSSRGFLQAVTPEAAVTSLGERNRFGHPHIESVSRLMETESELYYTSRDKALVFKSDGKSIQRVHWE